MSDLHLLIEEQLPRLMRYASALTRDDDQAVDLVEDTVIEAVGRAHPAQRGLGLRLWLLTILHEQRSNPFRQGDPLAALPQAPVDSESELTLSDLDRALGRLPEAQRAVILLIGLEGLTYQEAAAVLGISLGTLRSRLTRGRDNLRRAMGVADQSGLAQAA